MAATLDDKEIMGVTLSAGSAFDFSPPHSIIALKFLTHSNTLPDGFDNGPL